MLTLANTFILALGAVAMWIGTAAVARKRTIKRRNQAVAKTDTAA